MALIHEGIKRYYHWVQRGSPSAVIAACASLAIGVLVITWGLHLAGDFTGTGVLFYFLLLPAAGLVIPRARMVWAVAGFSSLAYLTLVVAETSGLAPTGSGRTPGELRAGFGFALAVVLGLGLVAGLMGRITTAVERQRTEQTRLREEVRRRAEAEAIWSTVGKMVVSTLDLDQVLTAVVQLINARMQVETGSVLLREPGTDELIFAKSLRGSTEQFVSFRLRVGQGVAGWVAQTGQSALVLDTAQDPRFFTEIDRQTGFRAHSILCTPLIVQDEVIGVIELLNKQGGAFTSDDLRLLESIAAPLAIAIQNARLHQQAHKQLTELSGLFHQVQRAKKEWEQTVDAIGDCMMLVDEHCRILRANRALADCLGTTPSALISQYCYQIIHGVDAPPSDCPHAQLMVAQDQTRSIEMDLPRLKGTFHFVVYALHDQDGKFSGSINVLKDITAEKRLQAQLIQSEKMAATGRLAASIAHEINNPLQAIQGCLDLAQANSTAEKQQRYLAMAQSELSRLASIVQRMLDFYRPTTGTPAPLDVRAVVGDALELGQKRLEHARIVVQTEWEPDVPLINGVGNQLKQVFLNLVLNAIEAMPHGGNLHIRGQMLDENGKWLTITFTDSGVGISPEARDKIFEPFYTTKADGTGLGLSVCHNIIASHGGRVTVESVEGQGSSFTVWLPVGKEMRNS